MKIWTYLFLSVSLFGCATPGSDMFSKSNVPENIINGFKRTVYSRCQQIVAVYPKRSEVPVFIDSKLEPDVREVWALENCDSGKTNLVGAIYFEKTGDVAILLQEIRVLP